MRSRSRHPARDRRASPSTRYVALASVLTSIAGSGCMAQNLSRTVGRGNSELHVSAGGPLFARLGPAIPFPHTHVGGRYGATDWLDVDGSVNLLALPYGILAFDAAANVQLYRRPHGLAVASSARIYAFGDLNDAPGLAVFPELGVHLGGTVPRARWLHLYGGSTLVFSPNPPTDKPPIFFTPFFGTEWLLPHRRAGDARQHGVAVQAAWINPWDTSPSVVDYRPHYGAVAVYLGYRVRFGGLDR